MSEIRDVIVTAAGTGSAAALDAERYLAAMTDGAFAPTQAQWGPGSV